MAASTRTDEELAEYDDAPDVASPTASDASSRSEEGPRVGEPQPEPGRARLRKYVVTEDLQTVPVRHEEVRLEREPITEADVDQALAGPEISEEEHEIVLHEEAPVVEKRAVPEERVRLAKRVGYRRVGNFG